MTTLAIIEKISDQGFMPLFYHDDKDTCIAIVKTLYACGIRIVEFTNRGDHAFENFVALLQLKKEMPDLLLAIGTIHTPEEINLYATAGADFLISPFFDAELSDAAKQQGKLWIPGCLTPTEIHQARLHDCNLVKLYPCNVVGTGFVGNMNEIFKSVHILATGGVAINKEDISKWFNVGVAAVGFGSKLITKEMMDTKDYAGLETKVKLLMQIIKECRTA